MKRFITVLLCLIIFVTTLSGCSEKTNDVRILSVENSPAATLVHMLEQENNKSANNYISSTVNLPNRVRNLIADNECDIAVVPVETAALIFKRGLTDIKVLAGISTGGFELVTTETITDFSELKGKTIYLTDRDTIKEGVFKYLLSQYGVNPFDEVTFNYASDTKQLEENILKNEISFALLTSADAAYIKNTIKNITAFNITDKLNEKFKNPSIVTYCVIGKTDFVNQNPKAIEQLLKDMEESVLKSTDLSATVTTAKKYGFLTDDYFNEDFITACKADFVSGEAMKKKFSAYFKMLTKISSSLIGEKAPNDDFYFIAD